MTVTIYHNPRCSKSRQTLSLITGRGLEPKVITYMDDPPDPDSLKRIIDALGLAPRELIRSGEPEYLELGLEDTTLSDQALIEAMCRHPRLIQRPIVLVGDQARIGRPPEAVVDILP